MSNFDQSAWENDRDERCGTGSEFPLTEPIKIERGATYVLETDRVLSQQEVERIKATGAEYGMRFLVFHSGLKLARKAHGKKIVDVSDARTGEGFVLPTVVKLDGVDVSSDCPRAVIYDDGTGEVTLYRKTNSDFVWNATTDDIDTEVRSGIVTITRPAVDNASIVEATAGAIEGSEANGISST